MVFGIKDASVQELISAVIVPIDDSTKLEVKDVISFVNSRVNADFKKIRGRILFRPELPRNTVGKLLRRDMRMWAESEAQKG